MSAALEPAPTKLDERVLRAVPEGRPGVRAWTVARRARADLPTVVGILRGFEHLGRVSGRGGWWSR